MPYLQPLSNVVCNSVISANVTIEDGAEVHDSIIMQNTVVKAGTKIYKSIIAENVEIGKNCKIGVGAYAESKLSSKIYDCELAIIGENTIIPDDVEIGKNVAIVGPTEPSDYKDGKLESGDYIIKAGEI